jgi:hypothetical protein
MMRDTILKKDKTHKDSLVDLSGINKIIVINKKKR